MLDFQDSHATVARPASRKSPFNFVMVMNYLPRAKQWPRSQPDVNVLQRSTDLFRIELQGVIHSSPLDPVWTIPIPRWPVVAEKDDVVAHHVEVGNLLRATEFSAAFGQGIPHSPHKPRTSKKF